MKICIVTEQFYKSGGIERVLSHKIPYWLDIEEFEVVLITTENCSKPFFFPLPDTLKHIELGVDYDRTVPLTSLSNLMKAVRHFKDLRRVIKHEKPDFIITCCYGFDFYFLPLVKKNAQIINECHSTRVGVQKNNTSYKSKWAKFIRNKFERVYDAMVVLSKEEAETIKGNNVVVIPNPNPKSGVYNLSSSREKVVISAGRVAPVKGYERLIKLWAKSNGPALGWQLHIYGDGELEYLNSINILINSLGESESIKLKESVSNIKEIMNKSGVYAMTSINECFPMVLLEAMESSLPIIAYDVPTGPRNIIKNGETGFLIKEDNEEEFISKLNDLINDESLRRRLGKAAESDNQHYSLEVIMSKWTALFEALKIKNKKS